MELQAAVAALSALAHPSRLEAFRLVVATGPADMPAGEIASRLDVPPPTLSFHLAHLVRAGLLESRRDGRSILYSARADGIRALLTYVTEDCCGGRPELCAPQATGRGCGA